MLLQTQNLTMKFGGIMALKDVTLGFQPGQISAVIGPNGAGKTTFFNACCGVYAPTAGQVIFNQTPLNGKAPHQIAHMGIARTWQNLQIFPQLTLIENVMVGGEMRDHSSGFVASMLRLPSVASKENTAKAKAKHWLDLVGLGDRAETQAGNLAFGQQRVLEIARAMATSPQLLMLDEPAAGLSSNERDALMAVIRRIRDEGITVLLVEHDMRLVMQLADYVAVLNYGELIAKGPPSEVQANPDVIKAYLGEDE